MFTNSTRLLRNRFVFLIIVLFKMIKIIILFFSVYILFNKHITENAIISSAFLTSLVFFLILGQFNDILNGSINSLKKQIKKNGGAILLKPYSLFTKIFLSNIDYSDLLLFSIYFPFCLWILNRINLLTNFIDILLFLYVLFFEVVILISFKTIYLYFEISNDDLDNFSKTMENAMTINKFPFEIYPSLFSNLFTFVIPFGLLINTPNKIFLRIIPLTNILFYTLFGMIFFYFSWHLLKKALLKYNY